MLQAIQRTRLYEEVMIQLAELIRQGQLRPGDRLPPERVLAERLRVSRATVREALRVMERQGLVVSKPGAGTFISGGSAEELRLALNHLALRDIFELRMLIEPSIAALAAQRATPDDITRLEQTLRQQGDAGLIVRQAHDENEGSPSKADIAFHSMLAEATHNHALLQLGARLIEILSPSRNESLQTPQRARLSLVSHRRILGAIQAHAPDEARRAMEEHIRMVDSALFGLPADSIPIPLFTGMTILHPEEAAHD